MGACCSKTSSSPTNPSPPSQPEPKFKPNPEKPEKKNTPVSVPIAVSVTEQEAPKKEVFIVKHRKSQETERNPDQVTRKSTDRKEKVSISNPNTDIPQPGVSIAESGKAVGATVRTSSCSKEEVEAILIQCGRLSRSSSGVKPAGGETPTRGRRYSGSKRSFDFDMEAGLKNEDDETVTRRKPESRVSSPSGRRRRSRERDPQQQRSGSKERVSGSGSGSGGRRVSRSPNRRSESPNPNSNCASGTNRPGKMVSVPATDKTNNVGGGDAGGVKRIQVKRNAGDAVSGAVGTRTAASPRARSPRTNLRVLNENQNPNPNPQPVTLSRSNSRKAEQSPYRRNPLGEIDTNAGSEQPGGKVNNKPNNVKNSIAKEAQIIDEIKPAVENPKHNQLVSKTRSSRLSRDLDINPEALLGPNPNPNPTSYASLLLEDIQNFHQKNPNPTTLAAAPPAFSLPACVSKACSIMEAVADLNSATSTNQFRKENVMESEKAVNDDLMEPSLHKYVTVKRGGDADNEEHEIESSGSNSFAGSQQLSGWMSSSWEPNSGDSTNCWTSNSRSNGRDEVQGQKADYPRNGIGRGRLGAHGRSAYSLPNNVTAAST